MKKCSCCSELKEFTAFSKDSRKMDGKNSRCKTCTKKYFKERTDRQIASGLRSERKYTLISEEVKRKIVDLYKSGNGTHTISKMVGRSKTAVLQILRDNNLIRKNIFYRKHKFLNENYFDYIDSDDKAYFLGLLWADGCNYRNEKKETRAYQIHLALQERDKEVVFALAEKIFESPNIVSFINRSQKLPILIADGLRKTSKFQNVVSLRICSKHISNILNDYGMVPRKSLISRLPEVVNNNENLFRSFVRGYLDGDGWITESTVKKGGKAGYTRYVSGMIGSDLQMQEMKEKFNNLGFNFSIRKQNKMSIITLSGNRQVYKFLQWLYNDATVKMTRKYNIYLRLREQQKV